MIDQRRGEHCVPGSNECFQKARELGQVILQNELADRVRIAQEIGSDVDEIALADARAKFEEFYGQVFDVLKATITGEFPEEEKSGGCGGCCGGKH